MIKHIIFDFDGTIADSSEIGLKILNELSEKYHVKKISEEEISFIKGLSIKERFKYLEIPFYKLPQIAYDALKKYKTLINEINFFNEMDSVIKDLKNEGYSLSIISSNNIENINFFLNKHSLNYFDNILSSKNIFGKHKVLEKYIKNNKLKPENIIYVGDEVRDIEACKKINVKIVAVTWGFDTPELLEKSNPDFIINSPKEIINLIKNT